MIADFAKEKVFWTRKMNLKLVKFIESRHNIWNPKHPKYTSAQCRDRTYAEFAAKYGDEFTGQAVKERWTNIRSTFANYLRKLNASRSKGDGEEYKINWHLWEPCQFLLKVNKKVQQDSKIIEDTANDDGMVDDFEEIKEGTTRKDNSSKTFNSSIDMCSNIANNLVNILRGVQNDAFGLNNMKNGKVGQAVSKTLSQMSSIDAALASTKIMQILLLYDKDNPDNPNNSKMNNKRFESV